MNKMFLMLVLIIVAAFVLHSKGMLGTKRETLSRHETIAIFNGKSDYTCRGLTALCPDQCGHSGIMASFSIVEYLAYEKPGQYGDPKQSNFQFLAKTSDGELKVRASIYRQVEYLNPGDTVYLNYRHDYITTKGGSKFPERTVTKLTKK